jgi:hypothetical protein
MAVDEDPDSPARPERRSGRTDPTYAPRPVCIGRRPPCLRRSPGDPARPRTRSLFDPRSRFCPVGEALVARIGAHIVAPSGAERSPGRRDRNRRQAAAARRAQRCRWATGGAWPRIARLPMQIGDSARRLAGPGFGEDRDFVAASAALGGAVVRALPTSAFTRMRSWAATPVSSVLDEWIVAEALVSSGTAQEAKAIGRRLARFPCMAGETAPTGCSFGAESGARRWREKRRHRSRPGGSRFRRKRVPTRWSGCSAPSRSR